MRVNVPDGRFAGEMDGAADSICRSVDKIAAIQRVDSTDGMQHSHLLPSSSGSPLPERFLCSARGVRRSVHPPDLGDTSCCCSPVPSWRPAGAPSRRRCASWGESAIPTSAPSTASSTEPRGRLARRRGRLLLLLVNAFVPAGAPVVIGLDDTIERRWGAKISARGIYRDPVRSSKGHFVKTSGLRWLSAMLLVHVPWAGRIMALPFLTLLAPSKRFYAGKSRAPKTLLDWARQAALQIHRWLPDRYIVMVADSAFAAIEFLAAVRKHVCVVTRLRLDANLFEFPPPKRKGRGRPPIKGKPPQKALRHPQGSQGLLATLPRQSLVRPNQSHRRDRHRHRHLVSRRRAAGADPLASGARSHRRTRAPGLPGNRSRRPPRDILDWFVSRWQVEVTFEEVRAHLGVETQRQWSDNAILRTTPALLGLFSIVTLWTHDLAKSRKLKPRTAAWYPKSVLTFSDAIAAVRREIWAHQISFMSRPRRDSIEIPRHIWRMENALAYA